MGKILTRKPYGNYKVLNDAGEHIFMCDDRKVNWYLQRGLAKVVDSNTIQLLFTPNGPGHIGDDFYLQERLNKCVVCGSTNKLTRHHVVPYCYRRYFPDVLKDHSCHDVLANCITCHETYENYANDLKQTIANEFNMPLQGTGLKVNHWLHRVQKSAVALFYYRDKMPSARADKLLDDLRAYYGKQDITNEDIEAASKIGYVSKEGYVNHGQYVVDRLDDIGEFVKRWRRHFVSTMQPQYLPDGWDCERPMWRTI